MATVLREVSISETELELIDKVFEAHIRRLKGQIKNLKAHFTGKADNQMKREALQIEIDEMEEILSKFSEPFV